MLISHFKIALKVLRRRWFFTFISLFAIAFTLVVLLVATAMLDHIFAPHPPETKSDRTLLVMHSRMSGPAGSRTGAAGYRFLDRHVRGLPAAERVALASLPSPLSTYHDGRKHRMFVKRADHEFWRILEFEFIEGVPYGEDDERDGNRVAVINRATRHELFAGEPAVGRKLVLDGDSFRVVGVVENVPFTRIVPFADVWVPIRSARTRSFEEELVGSFMGIVLAPDASALPAIRSEIVHRAELVQFANADFDTLEVAPDDLFGTFARILTVDESRLRALLGLMAVLFLCLPTINLVNINLSRIMERSSEIGVRRAFGASSLSLVGQFLLENVVLTLVGGVLALIVAAALLAILNGSGLIPYAMFELNWRVFGRGLLVALLFGVLSGVYPAWRMSRLHPVEALRGGAA